MILLKDGEVKTYHGFHDAIAFLQKQREEDVWVRVPINQLQVHPLPNNPICLNLIMQEKEISSSEEAVLSAMGDTNILLSYPDRTGIKTMPIRSTAITSLKERAKLNGSALNKMPCEKRAITLNCGLEVWNELGLVLIRDEKISAIHSGDDADYSVLPMDMLLTSLQKELEQKYAGYKLQSIEVGHEMTIATIELPDILLEEFNKKLKAKGRKQIIGKAILKFASSDVGVCGANLYPYIKVDSSFVRVGKMLQVRHKNRASVEDFENNIQNLFTIFKESNLLNLLDYKVQNPYGCFLAIAKKCGLPKKASLDAAEDFEAFRPVECFAYDVYMGLWEIMRYINAENEHQRLNIEENISRAMNIDYASYDHAFEWL